MFRVRSSLRLRFSSPDYSSLRYVFVRAGSRSLVFRLQIILGSDSFPCSYLPFFFFFRSSHCMLSRCATAQGISFSAVLSSSISTGTAQKRLPALIKRRVFIRQIVTISWPPISIFLSLMMFSTELIYHKVRGGHDSRRR